MTFCLWQKRAEPVATAIEQVVEDAGRVRWFDADEALDYGFVDHLVTSLDEVLPRRVVRRVGLAATGGV